MCIRDSYRGGKKQFQMSPEKRIYLVSGQPQTMVAIHSVPAWDLYVVYELSLIHIYVYKRQVLGGASEAADDYAGGWVRFLPRPFTGEEMLTAAGELLAQCACETV